MRIYLAGPISGHEREIVEKAFDAGKDVVQGHGHYPVSPLDVLPREHSGECPPGRIGWSGHLEACHLRADLKWLLNSDAVYLLPGWQGSWGVRLELMVATAVGIRVFMRASEIPVNTGKEVCDGPVG